MGIVHPARLGRSGAGRGAPAGSNLQAGGLKPPEAVETDTNPSQATQTEAQLDRADKEDSGRGLEFVWLNAELGRSTSACKR